MPWSVRVVVGLAVCSACALAAVGQEPPAKPKAKVELRWLEGRHVKGLTEDGGFQATCDPKSVVYPHRKPALVLTAADVSEARLTETDFSKSGLGVTYRVTLHLTKEVRARLAATCEGEETRWLTVVVDGKYWGVHRYEKNKPSFPAEYRAEAFTPSVGYFSSKAEAERLVGAFK